MTGLGLPTLKAWMPVAFSMSETIAPAFAAISRAQELAPGTSAKEQALIAALAKRYSADPEADWDGDWEAYLQSVADEHAPIKRFGTVDELADFMVFLCSPRASYAVGGTYTVDGGMLRTI